LVYFKVAFVFGQKDFEKALESNVKDSIKKIHIDINIYAKRNGIHIDIHQQKELVDIKTLIHIKLIK